jgi:hypothetical protein
MLDSLVVTGEANVTIEVTVPAEEANLTNRANVRADQLDTDSDNDSDYEETVVSSSATIPPPDTGGDSSGGGSSDPLSLLFMAALLPFFRVWLVK